jgi:hypothetical protein
MYTVTSENGACTQLQAKIVHVYEHNYKQKSLCTQLQAKIVHVHSYEQNSSCTQLQTEKVKKSTCTTYKRQ